MYGVVSHQGTDRDQYRTQASCSNEPQDGERRRRRERRPIFQKILGYFRKQLTEEQEDENDEFNIHISRYRPEELHKLASRTKFTRKEIQLMYRGFKQECPTGMVDEDSFKHIFSQFFPLGDATNYAHYVFNTMKQKQSGKISFDVFVKCSIYSWKWKSKSFNRRSRSANTINCTTTASLIDKLIETMPNSVRELQKVFITEGTYSFHQDFINILSKVSRGSVQEKLQWVFGLYDLNGDGLISKTEMVDVVSSIYQMLGRATRPLVDDTSAKEHVEKIFHLIDTNKDGVVTIEELVQWCSRDENILKSLETLDTVL